MVKKGHLKERVRRLPNSLHCIAYLYSLQQNVPSTASILQLRPVSLLRSRAEGLPWLRKERTGAKVTRAGPRRRNDFALARICACARGKWAGGNAR